MQYSLSTLKESLLFLPVPALFTVMSATLCVCLYGNRLIYVLIGKNIEFLHGS